MTDTNDSETPVAKPDAPVISGSVRQAKPALYGRVVKAMFPGLDGHITVETVVGLIAPAVADVFKAAGVGLVERVLYGDNVPSRRSGGTNYHRVNGGQSSYSYSSANKYQQAPRRALGGFDEIILETDEDAELVLDTMNDIRDRYGFVSVADLNKLVGIRSQSTDLDWGWSNLNNARVRRARGGYILDLPQPRPANR